MDKQTRKLGNSTDEQQALRAVALWAADCAERALPLFESRQPTDARPREAIQAARAFGQGKKRDKDLRIRSLAALKAGKEGDEVSGYVAWAATLAASVAYTHTDLQTGIPGVRQARHVLGPAAYAVLAKEIAAGSDHAVGKDALRRAIETAPPEVGHILTHMPPQPEGKDRLGALYYELDGALR